MDIKRFTWIAGIFFVVIGILGFIPGVTVIPQATDPNLAVEAAHGRLLGLFPVNLVHNLVHVALGVWAFLVSKNYAQARIFCRSSAIIFALMTVAGLIPGLNTVFGLLPLYSHNIWLHAVSAFATGYYGFVRTPDQLGSAVESGLRWS